LHTLVLLIWFGLCAAQDLRQRRISNLLTLGGGALALAYLAVTGETWLGSSPPWPGLLVVLALTLPGYLMRRLGAGDVKLLLFLVLASSGRLTLLCLAGAGVWYLGWYLSSRLFWPWLSARAQARLDLFSPAQRVYPFAPFLFLGLSSALALGNST
jgi:prepilin peptidase CpaA